MDIEKLIEQYRQAADKWEKRNPVTDTFDLRVQDALRDAATALSTLQAENNGLKEKLYDGEGVNLVDYWMQQAKIEENGHRNCQAENEKLRAELEQVKRLYESEKEDFIDFACSGVPNLTPYCLNRHPDCVDERGWCRTEKCRGFSRERGQKED